MSDPSVERFARAVRIDASVLAVHMKIYRETSTISSEVEYMQHYLGEALEVIRVAVDIVGSIDDVLVWFKDCPVSVFDGKRPMLIVAEGNRDKLIGYLRSLQAGFAG